MITTISLPCTAANDHAALVLLALIERNKAHPWQICIRLSLVLELGISLITLCPVLFVEPQELSRIYLEAEDYA